MNKRNTNTLLWVMNTAKMRRMPTEASYDRLNFFHPQGQNRYLSLKSKISLQTRI